MAWERIGPSPDLEATWGPLAAGGDDLLPAPDPVVQRRLPSGRLLLAVTAGVAVIAVAVVVVSTRSPRRHRPVLASGVTSTTTATTAPTTSVPTTTSTVTVAAEPPAAPAASDTALAEAGRVAQQFVSALQRRDCPDLLGLVTAASKQFLSRAAGGEQELCASLAKEPVPDLRVVLPGRPGPDGGVVVDVSTEGKTEPLLVVKEAGGWRVDLLGTGRLEESSSVTLTERAVESNLRNAATAERTVYADDQRFTDDVATLTALEPGLQWRTGVAADGAPAGVVHVALADAGATVCLSATATGGTRYMLKDTASGRMTFASGDQTPRVCDGSPLAASWSDTRAVQRRQTEGSTDHG